MNVTKPVFLLTCHSLGDKVSFGYALRARQNSQSIVKERLENIITSVYALMGHNGNISFKICLKVWCK